MEAIIKLWPILAAIGGALLLTGRWFGTLTTEVKGLRGDMDKREKWENVIEERLDNHGQRIAALEGMRNITIVFSLLLLPAIAIGASWNDRLENLAKQTEAKYHLPHGSCRAFALQESYYDTSASRVESGYYNIGSRYYTSILKDAVAFLAVHHEYTIPSELERAQRSISYGLFQIMGQNYRALGYEDEFIHPTVEEQFEYFAVFLHSLITRYYSLARAASAYNTGNPNNVNRQYVKNILSYQRRFSY